MIIINPFIFFVLISSIFSPPPDYGNDIDLMRKELNSNGLVAYYPFNDGNVQDVCLEADDQNIPHHGGFSSTDMFNKSDSSMFFSGGGSYIEILNSRIRFDGEDAQAFTVCLSVNVVDTPGNFLHLYSEDEELNDHRPVMKFFVDGPTHDLKLHYYLEDKSFPSNVNQGGSTHLINTDEWVGMCLVVNLDNPITCDGVSLYVEGFMVSASCDNNPDLSTLSFENLIFGAEREWLGPEEDEAQLINFFRGSIDEIRFYNRALEHSEILFLHSFADGNTTFLSCVPDIGDVVIAPGISNLWKAYVFVSLGTILTFVALYGTWCCVAFLVVICLSIWIYRYKVKEVEKKGVKLEDEEDFNESVPVKDGREMITVDLSLPDDFGLDLPTKENSKEEVKEIEDSKKEEKDKDHSKEDDDFDEDNVYI